MLPTVSDIASEIPLEQCLPVSDVHEHTLGPCYRAESD